MFVSIVQTVSDRDYYVYICVYLYAFHMPIGYSTKRLQNEFRFIWIGCAWLKGQCKNSQNVVRFTVFLSIMQTCWHLKSVHNLNFKNRSAQNYYSFPKFHFQNIVFETFILITKEQTHTFSHTQRLSVI